MKELVKSLITLGLTAGLSDREAFVNKVSAVIEGYQNDPEKAEQWTQMIVSYLENVKDNFNMQSAVRSAMEGNVATSEQMDELTKAIKELTKELQKQK